MKLYKTIHQEGTDTYIINKSKFITHSIPISSEQDAIDYIAEMKTIYKDATHNVSAYVFGKNSNIQRYSDDGEPSGTAGIPVLNVLKQEELRNVCVVVTRYFGGTKLGAGGLIRAYGKSAKQGIVDGIIVFKKPFTQVKALVNYTSLGKIENLIENSDFIITDKEFTDKVNLVILSPEEKISDLTELLNNITGGTADIEIKESYYYSTIDDKIIN